MGNSKSHDLRIQDNKRPNMPAINETTLPLIATILAGFSVTLIAQVFTRSEANLDGKSPNVWFIVSLIALALSVPLFLHAVSFSIWAQAYNYLDLSEDSRGILDITEDWRFYIARLQRKWRKWHHAAIVTFYGGALLFDLGTGILLWYFIGRLAMLLFYAVTVLPLFYPLFLLLNKEKEIDKNVDKIKNAQAQQNPDQGQAQKAASK